MLSTERAQVGADHRFQRAAVVGAGLMGRGIAQVLAAGGLDVVLYDAEAHILDDSVQAIRARLDEADGHGLLTGAADLVSAVGDADLVVEAVTEDLGVKRDVFARISAATASAVLATTVDLVARNTIGLRLARLGPLENADYVGLDLTLAIHDTVIPALSRDSEPSHLPGGALRGHLRRGHDHPRADRGGRGRQCPAACPAFLRARVPPPRCAAHLGAAGGA